MIDDPRSRPDEEDPKLENLTERLPRYARRLSDKVLIAFHQACDQRDFEVARSLLNILEFMTVRVPGGEAGRDRRSRESHLVAAHERLWHIQHP